VAHTYQSTGRGLKLLPTITDTSSKINPRDLIFTAYSVFTFSVSLILIGLALRMVFALFMIEGAFVRGLTVFTNPFVSPFAGAFPDFTHILQTSTGAAFTFYYGLYWIVASAFNVYRKSPAARV